MFAFKRIVSDVVVEINFSLLNVFLTAVPIRVGGQGFPCVISGPYPDISPRTCPLTSLSTLRSPDILPRTIHRILAPRRSVTQAQDKPLYCGQVGRREGRIRSD